MNQENQTARREEGTKQKGAPKKGKAPANRAKPSLSRLAIGVTAAGGAGFIAVSVLGLGPVLVAGTAGYLAYQGMTRQAS